MSTSNLNKIDARMQQKHDIAANWKNSDFVPEAGEYIIYDPDEYTSFPRIKIGDGIHTANELFFVSEIYTDTEEPLDAEDGAIWFNPEDSQENILQDLIDATLSIEGKAADAKAVGDAIANINLSTESLNKHIADTSNPHKMQLSQLGVETPASEIDEKLGKITDGMLLPQVTEDDNDKVLAVVDGAWTASTANINNTQASADSSNYLSIQMEVDQVCTSRRVQRYLAKDLSDDKFIRLTGEALEYVVGKTYGTTKQALTPEGQPLYWEGDISLATIGDDGYPYVDEHRISATTKVTSWPVQVYSYTETVHRTIKFDEINNNTLIVDRFGPGSTDKECGLQFADELGFRIMFESANGVASEARFGKDGYLDLIGLRKPSKIDFSNWDNGTFCEKIDGIADEIPYSVDFDTSGRPVLITDETGHMTEIVW